MSSALAIAAVTASIRDRLNNGLLDRDLSHVGSVSVTAIPPDRISTGTIENNQLNLFLYQVTPNAGWRNAELPSRDRLGNRVTNPPLALDLHYLLTAYGAQDFNAEVLLGYAMQLLHQYPGISREQLRQVLANPSPVGRAADGASILPGVFGTASAEDLADQVELIKITPVYLGTEDLSRLWTSMQARYRPSMAYQVSVVLIQGTGPNREVLPVLRRGGDDRGPVVITEPLPSLASVRPASTPMLPAARLGDTLRLYGTRIDGQPGLAADFEYARTGAVLQLPTTAGPAAGTLDVALPSPRTAGQESANEAWSIGMYAVTLSVGVQGLPTWSTNAVPIALAPVIEIKPPLPLAPVAAGQTMTVACMPRLLAAQVANTRVIFGAQTVVPQSVDTPSAAPGDMFLPSEIKFVVPDLPPGRYVIRLRVDGIDSLPIAVGANPPFSIDPAQQVQL